MNKKKPEHCLHYGYFSPLRLDIGGECILNSIETIKRF